MSDTAVVVIPTAEASVLHTPPPLDDADHIIDAKRKGEDLESPNKKPCYEDEVGGRHVEDETPRLEDRLWEVLCCAVCRDLPPASIFQVGDLLNYSK